MKANLSIFQNPLAKYENFESYGDLDAQTEQIGEIIEKHDEIQNLTNQYNIKYSELDQNTQYKDFNFLKPDGEIWLDYKDRQRDIKDAEKEDLHVMITQYNNAYIIGMITIATVLIASYVTLRK
jgi:hypothetical protein